MLLKCLQETVLSREGFKITRAFPYFCFSHPCHPVQNLPGPQDNLHPSIFSPREWLLDCEFCSVIVESCPPVPGIRRSVGIHTLKHGHTGTHAYKERGSKPGTNNISIEDIYVLEGNFKLLFRPAVLLIPGGINIYLNVLQNPDLGTCRPTILESSLLYMLPIYRGARW